MQPAQTVQQRYRSVPAEALEAALDRVTTAILVLDPEGQVVHSNRFFHRLVASHGSLELRDQRLWVGDAADQRRLDAFLSRHAEPGGADAAEHRHLELGREQRRPLSVYAAPCEWSDREAHGLVLHIRSPLATASVNAGGIAKVFGLTERESELLAALADGQQLEEFAVATHRSPHTLRAQLKSIYRKLGVRRQIDLIRMVLTSTAFLLLDDDDL